MKNRFYLTKHAENDLDETISYLASRNISAAELYLSTAYEAMEMLAANPRIGHLKSDFDSVRFWTFKWHHMIIYKDTQPLVILRVVSGYRDLNHLELQEPKAQYTKIEYQLTV